MTAYVLYEDGWPAGVFGSYAEVAERLGVKVETARWYGTAHAKRAEKKYVVQKVEVAA